MNKKYVYICVSLLFYGVEITSSDQANQDLLIHDASEYKPGKFTDQISFVANQLTEKVAVCYAYLQKQYDAYNKQLKISASHQIDNVNTEESFQTQTLASFTPSPYSAIKKSEPLIHLKKYKPDIHLTKQQTYMVAATVAGAIALSLVYKYGWFSSSKEIDIAAQDIQQLIESVVHNMSIPKQDLLNNVFEVLISNGLENIVVYNEHLFEVNDRYKVEIKGKSVRVTRS